MNNRLDEILEEIRELEMKGAVGDEAKGRRGLYMLTLSPALSHL